MWHKLDILQSQYPSIRFLLPISNGEESKSVLLVAHNEAYFAIEKFCPHSGGPLEFGQVIDIEDSSPAIICPYHHYQFNLSNGLNPENLNASVWPVKLLENSWHIDLEDGWSCGIPIPQSEPLCALERSKATQSPSADPKSLLEYAVLILTTPDCDAKTRLTFEATRKFLDDEVPVSLNGVYPAPPNVPSREVDGKQVHFSQVMKLGKGGSVKSRIAILHNLANVELWAIDLAWDAIARFARFDICAMNKSDSQECSFARSDGTEMPREFFVDFVTIASEEAKHHNLLRECLHSLGSKFGDLPTHGRLWDSALDTKHSLLCRLAIVNMVHEARGLDVNLRTIEIFHKAGELSSAVKLETIHHDEIGHVYRGQKWFQYLCDQQHLDKYSTFQDIVKRHFKVSLRPPFNQADRLEAGIDAKYYMPLVDSF